MLSANKASPKPLSWLEINQNNLIHNLETLRRFIGEKIILCPSVKANAYGHGLIEAAQILNKAGADWLSVNALFEAYELRKAHIRSPIYIMGYVPNAELPYVVSLNCRIVVYNKNTVQLLSKAAQKQKKKVRIHIKIETGNYRQGVAMEEAVDFVKYALQLPGIEVEGIATHFADIEDAPFGRINFLSSAPAEPDASRSRRALAGLASPRLGLEDVPPEKPESYAMFQLANFKRVISQLARYGITIPLQHCANSAATILFPETHFTMVRPGIAVYGLWPSYETKLRARKMHLGIELKPALTWKTRIAQIKQVPKNASIGYGCTYRAKRPMKLAILPVGYYDGYDRGFSNKSHVLIHGKASPICGRVCMNMIMADVTGIPNARVEDKVTLLGKDGREEISADYLAKSANTINYEITTRINEKIPRIITS